MRRNVAHFIGGATRITGAGGMTILGCTLCGAAISAVGGGGHNALCTDCYEALTQPLSENGLLLRDAYADARRALSRKDADAIQSARDEAVEEAAKVADRWADKMRGQWKRLPPEAQSAVEIACDIAEDVRALKAKP